VKIFIECKKGIVGVGRENFEKISQTLINGS
jgi:hypothetical protein